MITETEPIITRRRITVSEYIFLYIILGAIAGLLAGLFGIGGGIILVPFLAWIFVKQGIHSDLVMLMAIATSLATIIPTSISSVTAHHRLGNIRWNAVLMLGPAIFVGSMAGAVVADSLKSGYLENIFGVFLLLVSVQMGLNLKPKSQTLNLNRSLAAVAGFFIGVIASILGIGGGTVTVPLLMKCKIPIKNAVAISSACGIPIAVAGTLGYIYLGWDTANRPEWSLGYVLGPAFLGVVVSSILFAPLGAKLVNILPTNQLKRGFAVLVLIMGLKLLA